MKRTIRTTHHPPRVIRKSYAPLPPEPPPEAPMPWDDDYDDGGCFFDSVAMARDQELPVKKNAYFIDDP